MRFDPVHDAQSVFRSLLAAASFPGTLRDIAAEASRVEESLGVDPRLAALALVLLDGETSFAWLGEGRDAAARTVSKLCSCQARAEEEADFLFASGGAATLAEAFSKAKEGDLVDPERGATVVCLADSLSVGGSLSARGPGIKGENRFAVAFGDGAPDAWLEAREKRNAEFPLGVDLVLVDRRGGLMAIPRTTRIGRA